MKKTLRSGFTTGACAAAAAKAAAMMLSAKVQEGKRVKVNKVDIPFPDGSRHTFRIKESGAKGNSAWASIMKDAGDDPDVTNGAEVMAEAKLQGSGARGQGPDRTLISIKGGKGVGIVTKPGLPVPVGEPAINPVPRKMIEEAVREAIISGSGARGQGSGKNGKTVNIISLPFLEITISVPNGEALAKKTLNHRLGIEGGISILGTTGIVKPVSVEAWTATISSSMDVAKAMGYREIVLSAGRTSEKSHMRKYNLPEEQYALMGDHLEFSLLEAKKHGFRKIHLCAQWAKMVKIAMATPQTHVRFGAIDMKKAVEFLSLLGLDLPRRDFNTAREVFDLINSELGDGSSEYFSRVCKEAVKYSETINGGIPVAAYLVSYEGEIIASSE